MKGLWRSLLMVVIVALVGCEGGLPGDYKPPGNPPGDGDPPGNPPDDPFAPCTDLDKCCPPDKVVCSGDGEGEFICTCSDLWDCSKNPNKCEQPLPTPDGGGGWDCELSEFRYECSKPGAESSPPVTGAGDWYCQWNEQEFTWECQTTPPNPSNNPDGNTVWSCEIDAENGTIVCEREGTTAPPPDGSGEWDCVDGVCTKTDDDGGLPPGGSDWKCHQTVKNGTTYWVCYGVGDSGNPPGGNDWNCVLVKTEFGEDIYKCEREADSDYPPGGGYYSCYKGSEFGGTVCEPVTEPPAPPSPEGGGTCVVGERMWCDGLIYCGWGQVECDPATNTWKTKLVNGQTMLDCSENLAGGKVPNTVCACYHYFYNPSCCERPDCLVPTGTSGQVCPASGGGLCDYCNPQNPECSEPGAKCIVTNAHETFCGRDCSTQACPTGYTCMQVNLQQNVVTKQCVPSDYSCYY